MATLARPPTDLQPSVCGHPSAQVGATRPVALGRRQTLGSERGRSLAAVLVADVLIVGAGPAGVAAAVPLAAAGRDVVVVDKAVFPRDKCCGDGLDDAGPARARARRLRPDDGRRLAGRRRRRAALAVGPRGRRPAPARGRRRSPPSRRGVQLDAALVDLAVKAGATVLAGPRRRRHGRRSAADHVVVGRRRPRAGGGPLRHRRRRHVEPDPQGARPGRARATSASGTRSASTSAASTVRPREHLYVWFDADLLPGYAWSFPLPDGRANVGFGVLRDGTRRIQDMKELWAGLLDRPHVRAALGPRRRAGGSAHGVADPGRHRPGHARRRPRRCSSATRRWPPT